MPFPGAGAYTRFKTFINGGTMLPSDLNSIQNDLGNKIAELELKSSVSTVSALPTTGLTAGQIAFFQSADMSAQGGVEWQLKYGGSSAFPWNFLGGSELFQLSGGAIDETLNASDYTRQLAGGTPSLNLPLHGDYMLSWGARVYVHPNNYFGSLDLAISNGTLLSVPTTVGFGLAGAGASGGTTFGLTVAAHGRIRQNDIPASTWRLYISGNVGGASFTTYDRWIAAVPIRVAAS